MPAVPVPVVPPVPVVEVLTPAVIEEDLCRKGHGNDTAMDHATLHLRAAAPALVLALIRAALEPQIDIDAAIVADLALAVHILDAHPDMEGEDARAPSAALLHGNGFVGGQEGLVLVLVPQATAEQKFFTLAGSGVGSPLHPSGDTTDTGRNLQNATSVLVREVSLMCS